MSELSLVGVSAEEWATRYDIEMAEDICRGCGKMQKATIPFAAGHWRGFRVPDHGCPEEFNMFVAVSANKKKREEMKLMFRTLADFLSPVSDTEELDESDEGIEYGCFEYDEGESDE